MTRQPTKRPPLERSTYDEEMINLARARATVQYVRSRPGERDRVMRGILVSWRPSGARSRAVIETGNGTKFSIPAAMVAPLLAFPKPKA